jgi:TPR repeat protein
MYFNGFGVPQDYVLAYMWFSLAVAHSPAAVEKRNLVMQRMTQSEIAEAERLAHEWRRSQYTEHSRP